MEDDSGLARLLQKNLSRLGYQVETAADGNEGLARVAAEPFDLVLVDYNMPTCGGIDVIRALAGEAGAPPVIMVTGNGNERVAVEALKLGATDYLVKDVEMGYLELLPIVIEQVLQKQELVREREEMFNAIRESEERYRKLVELSPDGITITNDGRLAFINPAGVKLLDAASADTLIGRPMNDLLHPQYRQIFAAQCRLLEENGGSAPWIEQKFVRCDGTEIDVEVSGVPFLFKGRKALQIIFRDITERKQAKLRLEQMAHFDVLTGLPNRFSFFDRCNTLVEQARRYNSKFGLMFLDLDRFKDVNDSLGHDAGDLLLREVAIRLVASVRKSDTVARVGGDEFIIILTKISEMNDAAIAARKVIEAIEQPFVLNGQTVTIGISIGISTFPLDGISTDTLLKRSDTAMYQAKNDGRNCYRFTSVGGT